METTANAECRTPPAGPGEGDAVDWQYVACEIRPAFDELARRIALTHPHVSCRFETTRGTAFARFVYLAARGKPDADAAVVGVLFRDDGAGGIRVSGDVGGEESGRVFHEEPERRVRPTNAEVAAAGRAMAAALAARESAVEAALEVPLL